MIKPHELLAIVIAIILANGLFLFLTDNSSSTREEIYTVSSVMARVDGGQAVTSQREIASVKEIKVIPSHKLAKGLQSLLQKFQKVFAVRGARVWKYYSDECLAFSAKNCSILLDKVLTVGEYYKGQYGKRSLLAEVVFRLSLLECNIAYRNTSLGFEKPSCSKHRALAIELGLSEKLRANFSFQCEQGNDSACVEKYFYELRGGAITFNKDQVSRGLYKLCRKNYLNACHLWVSHFNEGGKKAETEGVMLYACIMGSIESCDKLAHVGAKEYSDRAIYYMVRMCIDDKKHCSYLTKYSENPIVSYYKMPLYQQLCQQNYANFCHLLALEEIKKYGIVVAKANLLFRCDNYFSRQSRRCNLKNNRECEGFSRLCAEYNF